MLLKNKNAVIYRIQVPIKWFICTEKIINNKLYERRNIYSDFGLILTTVLNQQINHVFVETKVHLIISLNT